MGRTSFSLYSILERIKIFPISYLFEPWWCREGSLVSSVSAVDIDYDGVGEKCFWRGVCITEADGTISCRPQFIVDSTALTGKFGREFSSCLALTAKNGCTQWPMVLGIQNHWDLDLVHGDTETRQWSLGIHKDGCKRPKSASDNVFA
jgi:hypothetical protein